MRSGKHWIVSLCIILTAASFLLHPQASAEGISRGLSLCARSILPSLFPFFVLSNLWIAFYSQEGNGVLFSKFFHLPACVSNAWLFGALAGYPVGAKTVAQLYESKRITKDEANHALMFCCNAGPAFAIGVLGNGVLQSGMAGFHLYLIHLTASVLLGILLRPDTVVNRKIVSQSTVSISFPAAFVDACRTAISTTMTVCGFLLFFCVLTSHLLLHLPETLNHARPMIAGLLELTNGASILNETPMTPSRRFILCAGLLGWGGLCVHGQTVSLLPASLSAGQYLLGKGLHSLISLAMACLLLWIPSAVVFLVAAVMLLLLAAKSSSGKTTTNQI